MSAYMPLKFTSQAERIFCQAFNFCNHCLDQHLQRFHSFHNIWFCESLWDRLCWLLYFTWFLSFPPLCPERSFEASNHIPTAHPPAVLHYTFSKFNKPLKKMSIPAQLHWGVIKLFIFSLRVELIHSSTLPMQINCHHYLGTGKRNFCSFAL